MLNRLEVQDLAYVVGSVKDLRTENSSANVETNYRRRWKISGKSGPDGVGQKSYDTWVNEKLPVSQLMLTK